MSSNVSLTEGITYVTSFDPTGWLVIACLLVCAYLAHRVHKISRELLSVQLATLILIQKDEQRSCDASKMLEEQRENDTGRTD